MSQRTSIEWTDRTWNPTRGCSRVSEGCRNCYAERMAARFSNPGEHFHGFAKMANQYTDTGKGVYRNRGGQPRWTGRVELIASKLDEPLRWRKPSRVFVNSMSDLFHEALSDMAVAAVFSVMETAQRHTFQVLTKRPARMRALLSHVNFYAGLVRKAGYDVVGPKSYVPCNPGWPLPNVWLGVSVEDQKTADERIPLLLQTPAAVRFVSYEPALRPVDFTGWLHRCDGDCSEPDSPHGEPILDWVIVGGESGPGARPFDVAWARETVRQCREAGVACFVKQLGAKPIHFPPTGIYGPGGMPLMLNSPKGGEPAEWPEDLRVREFPT